MIAEGHNKIGKEVWTLFVVAVLRGGWGQNPM